MLLKEQIQDDFPFITVITYGNHEYVGIIINQDNNITSIYDYNILKGDEHKKLFLELGEIWWWESNRMIPINIFLKNAWNDFRYSLITLTVKDIKEQKGHIVSLNSLANKRTKRRVIQLVRKLS